MAALSKFWDFLLKGQSGTALDQVQPPGFGLGLFSDMHRDGGRVPDALETSAVPPQEKGRPAPEETLLATPQTFQTSSLNDSIATDGTSHTVIDLAGLASPDGFTIQGDAAYDNAGFGVSDAGDVNGDGFGDVIVGARLGDDGGFAAGEAYVIFGKAGGLNTIDLTGLD